MTDNELHDLFERHNGEFLKFDRITEAERRHSRPDLCAFLYLHDRFGGDGDIVDGARHEEIFLSVPPKDIAEEDVVYLHRCGVRYDIEQDSLCMFV